MSIVSLYNLRYWLAFLCLAHWKALNELFKIVIVYERAWSTRVRVSLTYESYCMTYDIVSAILLLTILLS